MPISKVILDFENCYGIKALCHEFDFSGSHRAYAIYAPNGAMKTSFAQTFRDFSSGQTSGDRIYPDRPSKRVIQDSSGTDIAANAVLVVSPYDEDFRFTDNTATLLVNTELKREYEALQANTNRSKKTLLAALKRQSKSKQDIEGHVSLTFTKEADQFCRALVRVREEVSAESQVPFADVPYDTIFNDKVLAFLDTEDFKTAIAAYVETYNKLLDASTYFSRNTFNYYNASQIARSLAANGFFKARHSVNLRADTNVEITSRDQLESIIEQEKSQIINDPVLKRQYEDIEGPLTKNKDLRAFQSYLAEHPELLPRLENVDSLREDIWKSYFGACFGLYEDVISKYQGCPEKKPGDRGAGATGTNTVGGSDQYF